MSVSQNEWSWHSAMRLGMGEGEVGEVGADDLITGCQNNATGRRE